MTKLPLTDPTKVARISLFAALLTKSALVLTVPSQARTPDPSWNPTAVERLVKLPGAYLKKAVENDFAGSGLAATIRDTESLINLKKQTLSDVQAAIDQSDGNLRIELQHQFLTEKRAFIELVGKQQEMRRQQQETKVRIYERLLDRMERNDRALSPQTQALLVRQDEARTRLEGSISEVDLRVFNTPVVGQSKYAKEYASNVVAIEQLAEAVKAHPMNSQSDIDGQSATKKEYLRHLISEADAELQVIDQEESIVAYMAKLVALDAMALSEVLIGGDPFDDPMIDGDDGGIADSVDFFITH